MKMYRTVAGRLIGTAGLIVTTVVLALPASAVHGAGTDCKVRNLTHPRTHASLQAAVSLARGGDTLQIKGLCRLSLHRPKEHDGGQAH